MLQGQKSARHYTEAARDEIKLLSDVREYLPASAVGDTRNCVCLHDWFEHRGPNGVHVCMIFEVGPNAWPKSCACSSCVQSHAMISYTCLVAFTLQAGCPVQCFCMLAMHDAG